MSKRGITEAEKLLDAIGQLPEDMLEQALETEENETETRAYRRQRRHRREIIGGLAAFLIVLLELVGLHDEAVVELLAVRQALRVEAVLQLAEHAAHGLDRAGPPMLTMPSSLLYSDAPSCRSCCRPRSARCSSPRSTAPPSPCSRSCT